MFTEMNNSQTHQSSYLWPAGIFFLCAFLVAVACYAAFGNINAIEKTDVNKTLVSVGQLKTGQIRSYLSERKNDAAVILSFLATQSAQSWLAHRGGDAPITLNQLTESVATAYRYRGILLLDAEANVRLNTGRGGILTESGKAVALRAMRERSPASFKIYFGDPSTPEEPILDTYVPVMGPDGKTVIGMVVLRNELKFLFQLLQTWPVESATAESLLVTRDGNDVLFLNDPRYHKGAAARLRIPLNTDTNSLAWPAMSAVTGHVGLVEANDYRGTRVLAYTLAVPETPWSMVVKIDLDEALEHSQRLLRLAIIIAVTIVILTGNIIWLWWRKDEADKLANRQLQASESRYRRLHESMMDAYVMVDMSGHILESNPSFQDMLGYSADELQQVTSDVLTPEKWHGFEARIIQEQVIPDGFSRLYEQEYIRKDGTVFPAEVKYFLFRDANNQPEAMWAIVRDITERKQVEEELNRFFSLVPDLVCIASTDGRFLKLNSVWQETLGYTEKEILATPFLELVHPDDREATMKEVARQRAGETTIQFINRYRCRDGGYKWLEWRASSPFDKMLFASARDITERKNSEQRMRELTAHLQTVREEEKASIAREIHDDLGGTLTALKMEAYWLAEELSASKDSEPFLKHVELISQLTDNAVNVTRRVITGLRPTVLDDLGLLAALEWQAGQFYRHTGIVCRVNSIEDTTRLDRQYSIALFRIFQEALTNVARHSGASRVEVEFHCNEEEVMLSVSDNGRGLPDGHTVSPTSYGVRGMRERVEQLGGNINFDRPAGGGFCVTVTLPLPADTNKEIQV
jgi:PAS domain S-box-containing protein